MRKEFFCPVDDWDCPYCEKDGLCALGASASKECDEATSFFSEGEEDEDEDEEMTTKRNLLTCPNCGQTIEAVEDDVIDTSYFQDEMRMFCVGHCPKCKAQFQWDAVFKFSHVKDVEFYGEFENEDEE